MCATALAKVVDGGGIEGTTFEGSGGVRVTLTPRNEGSAGTPLRAEISWSGVAEAGPAPPVSALCFCRCECCCGSSDTFQSASTEYFFFNEAFSALASAASPCTCDVVVVAVCFLSAA